MVAVTANRCFRRRLHLFGYFAGLYNLLKPLQPQQSSHTWLIGRPQTSQKGPRTKLYCGSCGDVHSLSKVVFTTAASQHDCV